MLPRFYVIVISVTMLFSSVSCALASSEAPDVIKLKRDLEIAKEMVVKDVIVVDGDLTILGRVEGNVIVVGGTVMLRPGSFVGGRILVVGKISMDPAAQVVGRISQVYMPRFVPSIIDLLKSGWTALWMIAGLVALLGLLGISVLVIALIPGHMAVIVSEIERSFFRMFLWGLLWTLSIVPIAALLLISIVGIILIPLELFVAVVALLLGYIVSSIFIGNNILKVLNKPIVPLANAALGIGALFLIGFIPIIGTLVRSIFLITGFGAVMTSWIGISRRRG